MFEQASQQQLGLAGGQATIWTHRSIQCWTFSIMKSKESANITITITNTKRGLKDFVLMLQ